MSSKQTRKPEIPVDVLQQLLEKKQADVRKLEEELEIARVEANALRNHIHLISNPEIQFDWEGFVSVVGERSPSLAVALRQAEASTFDIGKLRLRAPEFEAEMIRLQLDLIHSILKQFAGISYQVQVYEKS